MSSVSSWLGLLLLLSRFTPTLKCQPYELWVIPSGSPQKCSVCKGHHRWALADLPGHLRVGGGGAPHIQDIRSAEGGSEDLTAAKKKIVNSAFNLSLVMRQSDDNHHKYLDRDIVSVTLCLSNTTFSFNSSTSVALNVGNTAFFTQNHHFQTLKSNWTN